MTREEATECITECEKILLDWNSEQRQEVLDLVHGIYGVIVGHNKDFAKIAIAFISAELIGVSSRPGDVVDITHIRILPDAY